MRDGEEKRGNAETDADRIEHQNGVPVRKTELSDDTMMNVILVRMEERATLQKPPDNREAGVDYGQPHGDDRNQKREKRIRATRAA